MAVSQPKIGIRRSPLRSIHFSCLSFSVCKFRGYGQNQKEKIFLRANRQYRPLVHSLFNQISKVDGDVGRILPLVLCI